jgi:signal transduction histidine kinase
VRLKAWRHTPDAGQGSQLRVDIIDSGGALPTESRKRLAGALSTSADAEPSGETSAIELGISLARRILKLHGGGVTVTSHDRGSVFTVTVPLDESSDSA